MAVREVCRYCGTVLGAAGVLTIVIWHTSLLFRIKLGQHTAQMCLLFVSTCFGCVEPSVGLDTTQITGDCNCWYLLSLFALCLTGLLAHPLNHSCHVNCALFLLQSCSSWRCFDTDIGKEATISWVMNFSFWFRTLVGLDCAVLSALDCQLINDVGPVTLTWLMLGLRYWIRARWNVLGHFAILYKEELCELYRLV